MKKLMLSSNIVDANEEAILYIKYVDKNGDIRPFKIKVLDVEDETCYAIDYESKMPETFYLDRITEIKDHEEPAK